MPNQEKYIENSQAVRNVGGSLTMIESYIRFPLLNNSFSKLSLNESWSIAPPPQETYVLIREEFSIGNRTELLSVEEIIERLNDSRNDVLLMPYEDFQREYFNDDNTLTFSNAAICLWLFLGFYDGSEFTPFVRLVGDSVQTFECHLKWKLF